MDENGTSTLFFGTYTQKTLPIFVENWECFLQLKKIIIVIQKVEVHC